MTNSENVSLASNESNVASERFQAMLDEECNHCGKLRRNCNYWLVNELEQTRLWWKQDKDRLNAHETGVCLAAGCGKPPMQAAFCEEHNAAIPLEDREDMVAAARRSKKAVVVRQELQSDVIRNLACCDKFLPESASEFCAECGYTYLDHLCKRAKEVGERP